MIPPKNCVILEQYPDSLQQLLLDEKFRFFTGQDGAPNTSDDLFRQIVVGDSTKIGLIKK
jgi:hypothetical protein